MPGRLASQRRDTVYSEGENMTGKRKVISAQKTIAAKKIRAGDEFIDNGELLVATSNAIVSKHHINFVEFKTKGLPQGVTYPINHRLRLFRRFAENNKDRKPYNTRNR